jgi:hypothetical protein
MPAVENAAIVSKTRVVPVTAEPEAESDASTGIPESNVSTGVPDPVNSTPSPRKSVSEMLAVEKMQPFRIWRISGLMLRIGGLTT